MELTVIVGAISTGNDRTMELAFLLKIQRLVISCRVLDHPERYAEGKYMIHRRLGKYSHMCANMPEIAAGGDEYEFIR
jgi:hypothetical protein